MRQDSSISARSLAAQALGWIDERTKAVSPSLHLSSTFIRDADNRYRAGYGYARDENPAFDQAEALLAKLEGGEAAMLFSSGMAAATSLFLALKPGDHVVAQSVMYWGLRGWLASFAHRWGLEASFVPPGDLAALAAAIQPGRTKLVWVETPANPTWEIVDVAAAAEIAHKAGARLAVDSTVATPVLTRPLALGADLVMHSATKYLNGHSDIVAGALVAAEADEFWARLRKIRHDGGAILGPFEAWLLLRGMRTLFVRVDAACRGALAVAQALRAHPQVAAALYPGLPEHPGHLVAARQMTGGFGGMLSIRVKGGAEAAVEAAARVRLWKRATSLGGVESLIEHRASVEGEDSPCPPDLLRLSVGLEEPGDLIADLSEALGE